MQEARLGKATYCSLGNMLEGLRGAFPSVLVGDLGWEKLQALSNRLPFCAADHRFGFEFHLRDPNPAADFCVIAAPDTRLGEFFRHQTEDAYAGLAGAEFISLLKEQTRDPDSFLTRTGAGIILEYDLTISPPGLHDVPGIFIVNRKHLEPRPAKLHEDPAALVATLRSAAGWDPDGAEMHHIERVWTTLADCGFIVAQAGVMPGRAQRAIRLVVQGVTQAKVADVLQRLQWPGKPSLATDILADFAGIVHPGIGINFDLTTKGVSPRLGLEIFRKKELSRKSELFRLGRAGWKPLIDRLEEKGWCLPDKADGLREWLNLDIFFGRDGVYEIRQVINHFKVVIDGNSIYTKAYAGMDTRRTTP